MQWQTLQPPGQQMPFQGGTLLIHQGGAGGNHVYIQADGLATNPSHGLNAFQAAPSMINTAGAALLPSQAVIMPPSNSWQPTPGTIISNGNSMQLSQAVIMPPGNSWQQAPGMINTPDTVIIDTSGPGFINAHGSAAYIKPPGNSWQPAPAMMTPVAGAGNVGQPAFSGITPASQTQGGLLRGPTRDIVPGLHGGTLHPSAGGLLSGNLAGVIVQEPMRGRLQQATGGEMLQGQILPGSGMFQERPGGMLQGCLAEGTAPNGPSVPHSLPSQQHQHIRVMNPDPDFDPQSVQSPFPVEAENSEPRRAEHGVSPPPHKRGARGSRGSRQRGRASSPASPSPDPNESTPDGSNPNSGTRKRSREFDRQRFQPSEGVRTRSNSRERHYIRSNSKERDHTRSNSRDRQGTRLSYVEREHARSNPTERQSTRSNSVERENTRSKPYGQDFKPDLVSDSRGNPKGGYEDRLEYDMRRSTSDRGQDTHWGRDALRMHDQGTNGYISHKRREGHVEEVSAGSSMPGAAGASTRLPAPPLEIGRGLELSAPQRIGDEVIDLSDSPVSPGVRGSASVSIEYSGAPGALEGDNAALGGGDAHAQGLRLGGMGSPGGVVSIQAGGITQGGGGLPASLLNSNIGLNVGNLQAGLSAPNMNAGSMVPAGTAALPSLESGLHSSHMVNSQVTGMQPQGGVLMPIGIMQGPTSIPVGFTPLAPPPGPSSLEYNIINPQGLLGSGLIGLGPSAVPQYGVLPPMNTGPASMLDAAVPPGGVNPQSGLSRAGLAPAVPFQGGRMTQPPPHDDVLATPGAAGTLLDAQPHPEAQTHAGHDFSRFVFHGQGMDGNNANHSTAEGGVLDSSKGGANEHAVVPAQGFTQQEDGVGNGGIILTKESEGLDVLQPVPLPSMDVIASMRGRMKTEVLDVLLVSDEGLGADIDLKSQLQGGSGVERQEGSGGQQAGGDQVLVLQSEQGRSGRLSEMLSPQRNGMHSQQQSQQTSQQHMLLGKLSQHEGLTQHADLRGRHVPQTNEQPGEHFRQSIQHTTHVPDDELTQPSLSVDRLLRQLSQQFNRQPSDQAQNSEPQAQTEPQHAGLLPLPLIPPARQAPLEQHAGHRQHAQHVHSPQHAQHTLLPFNSSPVAPKIQEEGHDLHEEYNPANPIPTMTCSGTWGRNSAWKPTISPDACSSNPNLHPDGSNSADPYLDSRRNLTPSAYPNPDPSAYPNPDPSLNPYPETSAYSNPDPDANPYTDPSTNPYPNSNANPGANLAQNAALNALFFGLNLPTPIMTPALPVPPPSGAAPPFPPNRAGIAPYNMAYLTPGNASGLTPATGPTPINPGALAAFGSAKPKKGGTVVFVWDMDETLILFDSLVSGKYAGANPGVPADQAALLGRQMATNVVHFLEEYMHFKEFKDAELMHSSDVKLPTQDDVPSASSHSLSPEACGKFHQMLSHYEAGIASMKLPRHFLEDVSTVHSQTNDLAGGWLAASQQLLRDCRDMPECTVHHVLVTTGHLVGTFAKLLLFHLREWFPHSCVFSASGTTKLMCFQRIAGMFGSSARYCVLGDGPEEELGAAMMEWPFVKVTFNDRSQDSQYSNRALDSLRSPGQRMTTLTAKSLFTLLEHW